MRRMTDAFTPLESLNLTGRYYRCLIRNGYKSIEQIEKYLAEHDELLSKISPTCRPAEILK